MQQLDKRPTSGASGVRGLASALLAPAAAAAAAAELAAGCCMLSTSNSLQNPTQWLVSWSSEGATCRAGPGRATAVRDVTPVRSHTINSPAQTD